MEKNKGSVVNDGQRVYPVDIFVLHHSTGPDFVDTDDLTIQDWYSNTGKARAYNNGAINPMHEHPGRSGQLTYSQAQFSGSADSSNKYNYKLVDLIKNPWGNVAWHAGNWGINTHSCGLENCGDYSNRLLEPRQLMCIADFLRGIDQELVAGGYPNGIEVMLHQEIYATACPGKIKEQRATLVDMINNPNKWNNLVFTVVPPVVAPDPAIELTRLAEIARLAKIAADKAIADKLAADKVIEDARLAEVARLVEVVRLAEVARLKALADAQANIPKTTLFDEISKVWEVIIKWLKSWKRK